MKCSFKLTQILEAMRWVSKRYQIKHIDSLFLSPTNVQFYPVRLSDVMRVSNSSGGTLKSLGLESKMV